MAGELAAAGIDGLRNYERLIRPVADDSRRLSPKVMGTIIPNSPLALRLMPAAAAALPKLTTAVQRFIWSQNAVGKALSSAPLPDYSHLVQPESSQPLP